MLNEYLEKDLSELTNEEVYFALLNLCDKKIKEDCQEIAGERKVYYISSEFLIGKMLSNNLINLGIYEDVKKELFAAGINLSDIEELENEPSLGNGGLGRLAACFIDSISTLNMNGEGIGLLYHYGLFKQSFENLLQLPEKNDWINEKSFLEKDKYSYEIDYQDFTVTSQLYNIKVLGFNGKYNNLRLFDAVGLNESLVSENINFDQTKIKENLTLFLYPDDSTSEGELLRIYQQYFMVSNAVQFILEQESEKGHDLNELAKHVVIQINDTHPTLVIPELIYQLTKRGVELDVAIEMTSQICAYTNHTILAEALEKWPRKFLETAVPHLMPIIEELNTRIMNKFERKDLAIIDENGLVHMAHLCIHYTFSVNGVAALHTDILKESELNNFYELYPDKFNNKTNGITFRRWLMSANNELANYIGELIGTGYYHDAMELEKLLQFADDDKVLSDLKAIKQNRKLDLKDYVLKHEGIEINEHSILDVQIKRIHEYKRQQMNLLYLVYKYLEIKKGNTPKTPITIMFGGKAAPAYIIAQDIIHFAKVMQELINNDPEVNEHLNVVFVTNYNVSYAEKLFPAADISEQISLASKEASGTGNMKFMLNGAVTLGTDDGANVEIKELVGEDNIFIFGKDSDEIIKLYEAGAYEASKFYDEPELKVLVDFIVSEEVLNLGNRESLERLHNELIVKDWFMTMIDLKEYIITKERVFEAYEDEKAWQKMSLVNIAKAGFFSSDRTIAQYNEDIWKVSIDE